MIVADTPMVDNLFGFDEQREAILEGMRVTVKLRDWFRDNERAVEAWAKQVAALG